MGWDPLTESFLGAMILKINIDYNNFSIILDLKSDYMKMLRTKMTYEYYEC